MKTLPENDSQIVRLSQKFYSDYNSAEYPEILTKNARAYNAILFQTHYDYFICVPFRSEIKHEYSFRFKKSRRSQSHKSGLDYQKIIILKNLDYIDDKSAVVDNDEYKETCKNLEKIKRESLQFVEDYIGHHTGEKILNEKEFNRRYKFSSLQYFHTELKI